MRKINLTAWPRREHFTKFSQWDYPHFNMCAFVDLTDLLAYTKPRGLSFTVAIVYLVSRAANSIPEFRYRIRPGEVVEHEVVHPAVTILLDDDLFSFCQFHYVENFTAFSEAAADKIDNVKSCPTLENNPDRDDFLFMTSIPWVSFTSFMHPLHLHPVDSVPRFAWGKYMNEGQQIKMPLSVQGHHAMMDGLHMGHFYAEFERYLANPQAVLAGGAGQPAGPGSGIT